MSGRQEVHIEFLNDQVPVLSINGQPRPLMHYLATGINGKLNEELKELIANCRNVGLYLYWFSADMDCVCLKSLGHWADKHPKELARDETGNTQIGIDLGSKNRCPSIASTDFTASRLRGFGLLPRHSRAGAC